MTLNSNQIQSQYNRFNQWWKIVHHLHIKQTFQYRRVDYSWISGCTSWLDGAIGNLNKAPKFSAYLLHFPYIGYWLGHVFWINTEWIRCFLGNTIPSITNNGVPFHVGIDKKMEESKEMYLISLSEWATSVLIVLALVTEGIHCAVCKVGKCKDIINNFFRQCHFQMCTIFMTKNTVKDMIEWCFCITSFI